MDDEAIKDIVSFGNKIVPTTWMVSGGKVLPMEFAVVPATYVVFLQHFLVVRLMQDIGSSHQDRNAYPYTRLPLGLPFRSRFERV